MADLLPCVAEQALVDHHCHGVLARDADEATLGLPELYYLGAALFRSALSSFLRTGLNEDLYAERTVVRLTRMLCADNAKRAYQLGSQM